MGHFHLTGCFDIVMYIFMFVITPIPFLGLRFYSPCLVWICLLSPALYKSRNQVSVVVGLTNYATML